MGSNSSKAKSKRDKSTTSSSTTSKPQSSTNNTTKMSDAASNAQVPKPSEVPASGAQPEQAAKSSGKTANYFELIEVSQTMALTKTCSDSLCRTDERTMV